MADIFKLGGLLFLAGLVPWTIGGMISFATRHDIHNAHIRRNFDPGGEPASFSRKAYLDALFNNPKCKWLCRIGAGMCWAGMMLVMVSLPDGKGLLPLLVGLAMPIIVWRDMQRDS